VYLKQSNFTEIDSTDYLMLHEKVVHWHTLYMPLKKEIPVF
jgi:hypothetical protein